MKFDNQSLSNNSPKVLVIEDNVDQWFMIRWALLEHFSDIDPIWLPTASEVLPYLDTRHQEQAALPDVILIDLYLPTRLEGLNVLCALKSNPNYQPIPAVVLSWSNQTDDITGAFDYLANAYIIKPTNYRDWKAELSILDTFRGQSTSRSSNSELYKG